MSFRSCLILSGLLAVLAVPTVARADIVLHCPATLTDDGKSRALDHVTVFNSSSGEMSDVPEEDNGWDFADFESDDRNFYIVCHYQNTDETKEIYIPLSINFCQQDDKNISCH
jgi:hypothetical protein